ncbi:MAG: hypothetical protein M3O36_14740 [Myxococcota bacterium]|nr:hypothetical protein [Myxococcota bacterium]
MRKGQEEIGAHGQVAYLERSLKKAGAQGELLDCADSPPGRTIFRILLPLDGPPGA